MNLFDPEVLKVVLPYLIMTGLITVVMISAVVFQLVKVQSQQNATQNLLVNLIAGGLEKVRSEVASTGNKYQETMEELRTDYRGGLTLMSNLVKAVEDVGEDTSAATAAHAERTIAAVNKGRAEIIHDLDENLALAVGRSITNQNRNHKEAIGALELSQRTISERIDQSGGSLASRLDKLLGQMLSIMTKDEYVEHKRELLAEMLAIKSAVARIEANQTRPLPPLPVPLSTEPGLTPPPALTLPSDSAVTPPFPVDGVQG